MARIMAAHHENQGSDLKIGLIGLSAGIVWIGLVAVIAYYLAQ